MEITLVQGLLLALIAFICGADACWEAFYWFRPLVVAFFAVLCWEMSNSDWQQAQLQSFPIWGC